MMRIPASSSIPHFLLMKQQPSGISMRQAVIIFCIVVVGGLVAFIGAKLLDEWVRDKAKQDSAEIQNNIRSALEKLDGTQSNDLMEFEAPSASDSLLDYSYRREIPSKAASTVSASIGQKQEYEGVQVVIDSVAITGDSTRIGVSINNTSKGTVTILENTIKAKVGTKQFSFKLDMSPGVEHFDMQILPGVSQKATVVFEPIPLPIQEPLEVFIPVTIDYSKYSELHFSIPVASLENKGTSAIDYSYARGF